MRINSISCVHDYSKKQVMTRRVGVNQRKSNVDSISQPSFKSNKGALVGIGVGALVGVGAAALIVATGGLAAAVAAVGATGVGAAGAGAGAQIGGIIGGIASGSENGNKKS